MTDPEPKLGRVFSFFKRILTRLFKRGDRKEDFIEQIHEAEEHSVLNADAVSMMEGVLQISDLAVRDVMVPRARVDFINIDEDVNKIFDYVTKIAHSRFPVTNGKKDEIIGILLSKDLLSLVHNKEENLRGLMRPAVFVPESKKLNSMLRDFRINRNHMAIVIDEYGGVSGLITIEDVLEQIVGDIEDEHDTDEEKDNILQIPNQEDRFRIKSETPLEQFNKVFTSNFSSNSVETIGGYVTDHLGHVPRRGECVELKGVKFEIQRADARRVHLLIAERIKTKQDTENKNDTRMDFQS